jgi:hypothetical protein
MRPAGVLAATLRMRDGPLSALNNTPLQVLTSANGYWQVLPAAASNGER